MLFLILVIVTLRNVTLISQFVFDFLNILEITQCGSNKF